MDFYQAARKYDKEDRKRISYRSLFPPRTYIIGELKCYAIRHISACDTDVDAVDVISRFPLPRPPNPRHCYCLKCLLSRNCIAGHCYTLSSGRLRRDIRRTFYEFGKLPPQGPFWQHHNLEKPDVIKIWRLNRPEPLQYRSADLEQLYSVGANTLHLVRMASSRVPLPLLALLPSHPLLTSSERYYAWLRIVLPVLSVVLFFRNDESRGFFGAIFEDSMITLLSPTSMRPVFAKLINFGSSTPSFLGCLQQGKLQAPSTCLAIDFSREFLRHVASITRSFIVDNSTPTRLRQLASTMSFLEFFRSILRPRVPASRISSPRLGAASPSSSSTQPEEQRLKNMSVWAAKRRYLFAVYALPALIYVVIEFGALAVTSISVMDRWVHKHTTENVKKFAGDQPVSLWDTMGFETIIVILGITSFVPVWATMWWAFTQMDEADRDLTMVRNARVVKKVRWEGKDVEIPMPKLNLSDRSPPRERTLEEIMTERQRKGPSSGYDSY